MIKGIILLFAILWGCYGGVFGAITNTVTVEGLGKVVGSLDYTAWTNRTIYSFRKIPYAQAPVNDLRFRPPVKVTTWNGTLNGTQYGNECPCSGAQTLEDISKDLNEDCLTLNVFVPKFNCSVEPLPVIFFIFGGAYESSYGTKFHPNYLLERDVILVTVLFRVGPLGLLSLHTDEVPGNVMFLDQIMAMQWVQDNIGYFGGDKDQVTLFGESSGSASVNLHLFSPLSKGLFHRAIMDSGAAFSIYPTDKDPVTSSTEIAAFMGCDTTDVSSITRCLKNATVQEILVGFNKRKASKTLLGWSPGGNRAVVQRAGTQKFLTDEPENIARKGNFTKVPLIGLVDKDEGAIFLYFLYESLLKPYSLWNNTEYMQRNFTKYLLNQTGVADDTGSITDVLTLRYFENHLGNYEEMVPGITDIFGSFMFKGPVHKMLTYNSVFEKSYLCSFHYLRSQAYVNDTGTIYPFNGTVNHGEELTYLFPNSDVPLLNATDRVIAKRMVELWANFATTGIPTANGMKRWPPISTELGPYLIMDREPKVEKNFLDEYTTASRGSAAINWILPLIQNLNSSHHSDYMVRGTTFFYDPIGKL